MVYLCPVLHVTPNLPLSVHFAAFSSPLLSSFSFFFFLLLVLPSPAYKPQKISPKFDGTVQQLLHMKIRDTYLHKQFQSDVMKPMLMDDIMDQNVQHLSGGELQRTAMCLVCLFIFFF